MRSEVFMEWKGLSDSEVAKSREKYGTNALTHIPPEPLWVKVLNGFKHFQVWLSKYTFKFKCGLRAR